MAKIPLPQAGPTLGASGPVRVPNGNSASSAVSSLSQFARPGNLGRVSLVKAGPGVYKKAGGVMADANALSAEHRGDAEAARIKGSATSRALNQVSSQLWDVGQKLQQNYNNSLLVDAEVGMDQFAEGFMQQLDGESDPSNWGDDWVKTSGEFMESFFEENKVGPDVRHKLEQNSKEWQARVSLDLQRRSHRRFADLSRTKATHGAAYFYERGNRDSGDEVVLNAVADGTLSESEGIQLSSRGFKTAQTAELTAGIDADPRAVLAALQERRDPNDPEPVGRLGPDANLARDQSTLDFVKGLEGFTPVSKWDYQQHSVGYGTRGKPGQKITKAEAANALGTELEGHERRVRDIETTMGYDFTANQRRALISFDFNTGDAESLLVKNGKRSPEAITKAMAKYVNATDSTTGKRSKLQGLVNRRNKEIALFNAESAPEEANPWQNYDLTPGERAKWKRTAEAAVARVDAERVSGISDAIGAGDFKSEADLMDALDSSDLDAEQIQGLKNQFNNTPDWSHENFVGMAEEISELTASPNFDPTGTEAHKILGRMNREIRPEFRQTLKEKLFGDDEESEDYNPLRSTTKRQATEILRGIYTDARTDAFDSSADYYQSRAVAEKALGEWFEANPEATLNDAMGWLKQHGEVVANGGKIPLESTPKAAPSANPIPRSVEEVLDRYSQLNQSQAEARPSREPASVWDAARLLKQLATGEAYPSTKGNQPTIDPDSFDAEIERIKDGKEPEGTLSADY